LKFLNLNTFFKYSFKKTWLRIIDFKKDAIIFLVLGSIVLGWIEYFEVAYYINLAFEPLVTFLLDYQKN
jgi:membrane-bound acyltransferase YfiQ involved in biofilm formation